MGEKEWADGVAKGAYKDRGTQQGRKRGKHGKTPRVGIRKKRMLARRK